MESPDLEIHANEKLKSEVLTAFVYAFSTFQRNFILGIVTLIRIAKLNLSRISQINNFYFCF